MDKELQRINLGDYIQTGEGGTALTYNHKDGKTLTKRSFARIISQEPDPLVSLSERFAVLAKRIHQKPSDTTRLT